MGIDVKSFQQWNSDRVKDMEHGNYENTIGGRCVECGDCCSNRLPMSQKEINQIKVYIKKHNIVEQKHGVCVLSLPTIDTICPFLNNAVKTHKCTIYPVRPQVCREYKCDCGKQFHPSKLVLDGKHHNVFVRETFFPQKIRRV